MAATAPANFEFEPRVWSDHNMAYFNQKIVFGRHAIRNDTLAPDTGRGVTVNFPFFKAIGGAEQPKSNESLTADNLSDDSFAATVFEVGKMVGFTDASFMGSATNKARILMEANQQIARVLAEYVDDRLNDEICTFDNNPTGPIGTDTTKYQNMNVSMVATAAGDIMTIRRLMQAKILAFGDKSDMAVICYMHPTQFMDLMIDPNAGFLKADANHPYAMINGYQGALAGMAIVQTEQVKKLPTQIGGKDAYLAHFHKPNAYGIINKADVRFEADRNIGARQDIIAATQWYGVKSFHAKIDSKDLKSGGIITTVSESLKGPLA